MPAGSRIRANNVWGLTTDNPLLAGALLFNSGQLALLPAVVGNHAIVTLDPLRQFGEPEIIIVTAHTAAATVATITRGAYGTTPRAHPQGTFWSHALVTEDVISVVTSSTHPTDPYESQLIFETDTDYYMGYSGSAWENVVKIGAWNTWTPVWTNLTVGAGTIQARYIKIGRTVQFRLVFILGAGSAVGTDVLFTLPVTASASDSSRLPIGHALYEDVTVGNYFGQVWQANTTQGRFICMNNGTPPLGISLGATTPLPWTTSDRISCSGTYEAAA
jgi:hypothetical protein